jgi:hypothetical protein
VIQEKLKDRLGIRVDYVKSGFGNSNDGNTSRRFFQNPSAIQEITKIDEELICKVGTILDTINCGADIDVTKFERFCQETALLFVRLYPWYPMTNSVHRVLIHGSRMISEACLPIGMLSEEAQEAQNKVYREYKLYHSRKVDRIATDQDVFQRMLAASDPLIHTFRKSTAHSSHSVYPNVEELLENHETCDTE